MTHVRAPAYNIAKMICGQKIHGVCDQTETGAGVQMQTEDTTSIAAVRRSMLRRAQE